MDLFKTCGACPEQYDALTETNKVIGYLRLRHGIFTVSEAPGSPALFRRSFPLRGDEEDLRDSEKMLLEAGVNTDSDGVFVSHVVRGVYLDIAEDILREFDEFMSTEDYDDFFSSLFKKNP